MPDDFYDYFAIKDQPTTDHTITIDWINVIVRLIILIALALSIYNFFTGDSSKLAVPDTYEEELS